MLVLCLSIVAAITQLAVPSLAVPVTASSLATRGQVCANSHSTVAGTVFHHRSLAITPRISPGGFAPWSSVWCAPNSRTYVVLTTSIAIAGDSLGSLLTGCMNIVEHQIETHGDGVLHNGVFNYQSALTGLAFKAWNAGNHQTTWGVLGAAISALQECMTTHGYGGADFHIYDGENLVGSGSVGPR